MENRATAGEMASWHPGRMGDVLNQGIDDMPIHLIRDVGHIKDPYAQYTLQVDLADSDEIEKVWIDGALGPRGLHLDGGSYHLKYWPRMTTSERETAIRTVAKKNRSMRGYHKGTELTQVNPAGWDIDFLEVKRVPKQRTYQ